MQIYSSEEHSCIQVTQLPQVLCCAEVTAWITYTGQGCWSTWTNRKQHLSRTYLAHHELESDFIIVVVVIIIIIIIIVIIIITIIMIIIIMIMIIIN